MEWNYITKKLNWSTLKQKKRSEISVSTIGRKVEIITDQRFIDVRSAEK